MEDWKVKLIIFAGGVVVSSAGWIANRLWEGRGASDRELFWLLRGVFNRAAFKGPYLWQSDHQGFLESVASALKSIKTGRSEQNETQAVVGRYLGPHGIRNAKYRGSVEAVEDRLQRIIHYAKKFLQEKDNAQQTELVAAIDKDRDEVIKALNEIWQELKIPLMRLPSEVKSLEEAFDLSSAETTRPSGAA